MMMMIMGACQKAAKGDCKSIAHGTSDFGEALENND